MNRIRVLIAEDHETVRQGLTLLINSQPDMEVVGEAGDGRNAVERAEALHPAVAVLDISMPQMNGLAATRMMRERVPATAVVALTRYRDDPYVKEMLGAGACGYVLKQSASVELLEAIRAAARGAQYLDSSLAGGTGNPAMSARRSGAPHPRITAREAEVLRRMAVGESNKDIAAALDVSVKTVEVHKANAMRKLGLGGRTDVVKYALLQGWMRDP
jgi:two-component system, NarL family, response regulator NreC